MTLTIQTNNIPRPIIYDHELTAKEREEFDYLDWTAIDEGNDSASFFRYRGQLYDLAEFSATNGVGAPSEFSKWDGYASDTYFSGVLVRYVQDFEYVIVGTYYS